MEELELIQAIVQRDYRCQERFVREFLPVCLRAFQKLKLPQQDIDDFQQGFFEHLAAGNYRRLRSFNGDSRLTTWLYRSARNFAIDQLRKRIDTPADPAELQDGALGIAHSMYTNEELVWVLQRRELIAKIVDRLQPEQYAKIIRRHYFQHQSIEKIAQEDDLTRANVRTLLSRARARLRQILIQDDENLIESV